MPTLRRILFALLLVVYIVLCPVLILYALGYVYEPGSAAHFIRTGLIHVRTLPSGASVFLDGRPWAERTPTMVRDLPRGRYRVEVRLDGHRPWSKTVAVQAERATALNRVLLVPERFSPKFVSDGPFDELVPVPGEPFFLFSRGRDVSDWYIQSFHSPLPRRLLPENSVFSTLEIRSVRVSPGSPFVLLSAKDGSSLWLRVTPDETEVKDVTPLVRGLSGVWWNGSREEMAFRAADGSIGRIAVRSTAVYPSAVAATRGAGMADGSLFYLDADWSLRETDSDERHSRLILHPGLLSFFFRSDGFYRIERVTRSDFLFLGDRGDLLTSRFPHRVLDRGLEGWTIDPSLRRVLIWSQDRLGTIDFSPASELDNRFNTESQHIEWLAGGRRIEQAFWAESGSYAVFRDENRIFLVEADPVGEARVDELFTVCRRSSIAYSEETGSIYYISEDGRRLERVEIAPRFALATLAAAGREGPP